MTELINSAREQFMVWKLAITRLLLFSLVTAGTAYLTSTATVHWGQLDGDARFKLVLGVGIAWANVIIAFLDKTAAKISTGQLPVGDTTFLNKDQTK